MRVQNLNTFIKEKIAQYPDLKEEIKGLYHLCLAEIAEGGDEIHETDLCKFDVEQLIEEHNVSK